MSNQLERFLTDSALARRARVDARVVVRRFDASQRELETAVDAGTLSLEAEPVFELVVGEQLVARGEIVTDQGATRFRVTEVIG
jgi:hypothetical protein